MDPNERHSNDEARQEASRSLHHQIFDQTLSIEEKKELLQNWMRSSILSLRTQIDCLTSENRSRKLHLGAGPSRLDGWLNSDILPVWDSFYYIDAREVFPIVDGAIDYIFSEHMIEHLQWAEGTRMLAQCFRVLRPGGRLRISTPDLAQIVSLYTRDGEEVRVYKQWATEYNNLISVPNSSAILINHFMRAWGHKFIYDATTLEYVLRSAGFEHVSRCSTAQSSVPELCACERHGEHIGVAADKFESLILEGAKP